MLKVLDGWAKQNLSKYKWLRGGYEFVDQARIFALTASMSPDLHLCHRSRSHRLVRYFGGSSQTRTSSSLRSGPNYSTSHNDTGYFTYQMIAIVLRPVCSR